VTYPNPWLCDELSFTTDGAAETAVQRVTVTPPGGTQIAAPASLVFQRVALERVSGAGSVAFTVRVYDAATGGAVRLEKALTVAAAATSSASQEGYSVLLTDGAWVTVQDSSGSAQVVKFIAQVGRSES
jgi:hypothetical protein